MMSRFAHIVGLIWLLGSVAAPTWAVAQCRLCDAPSGLSDERDSATPVQLEVESGLSFDRLVLVGDGEGAAILKPDGSRILTGSLGDFTGSAMVGMAVVRGEPGRMVRVELPPAIELHSFSESRLLIDQISSDLPSAPRLDSTGRLSFRFGGRLRVNGDADGDYRGDLPITADYL